MINGIFLDATTKGFSVKPTDIYSGGIILLPSTKASHDLIKATKRQVVDSFGPDYRQAHTHLSDDKFFAKLITLKADVYNDQNIRTLSARVISEYGFVLEGTFFDPPRLRANKHNGYLDPKAQAAFRSHRDTWYGNPQAQINWWLPLHDVTGADSFSFYPQFFDQPIANNSVEFDYDDWSTRVGFGNSQLGKGGPYPAPVNEPADHSAQSFNLAQGQVLLFSAAHLHRSNPNSTGLTRFSIDFRTVSEADTKASIGAPNVDNDSVGSSLRDYLPAHEANL